MTININIALTDVILTKLSRSLYRDKDRFRCIQAFEIENDAISKLYEIKLLINPHKDFTEEKMSEALGTVIQFELIQGKFLKYFSGIITRIHLLAFKSQNNFQYEITLKPDLWRLTQNNGYRSWIDKNSQEIITNLLKENYKEIKFLFHIPKSGELLKRKNTIQYGESDFDFLCRLLYEDGLNFLIEQTEQGQNIVFSDDIENYFQKKPAHQMQISSNFQDTHLIMDNFFGYTHAVEISSCGITSLFADSRKFGSLFESKSNNINEQNFFKWESHPNLNKTSEPPESSSSSWPNNEVIRKNTMKNCLTVTERIRVISVGEALNFKFTENKESDTPLNPSTYFAAKISHKYSKLDSGGNHYPTEIGQKLLKLNSNYCAEIIAYPKKNNFYLETFEIHKNNVPNITTATVYGEGNDNTLKIEKEKNGILIGISFFWQTKNSQFSWARLSQFWASKNYGALFIPQPGDEVLIGFINNDLEQPVIINSLYNSNNLPPKNLNEKVRGFILNEEQKECIQLGIKSSDSSFIFSEISLKTKIKQKTTIDLDEKSLTINIKDKVKIVMDDSGSYELSSEKYEVDGGNEINMKADITKINKLKIK